MPSKCLEALSRLAPDEWHSFVVDRNRPILRLSEAVGKFEPPFEHLATVRSGFSPAIRYLLDQVLRGDEAAKAARDDQILAFRKLLLLEESARVTPRGVFREFCKEHEDRIRRFTAEHYPWELSYQQAGVSGPIPDFGEVLDDIALPLMGAFGFRRSQRKRSKRIWRCHSRALSHEIAIRFEAGAKSTTLAGYLEVNDLSYASSLGEVFFFSGCGFPLAESVELREPVLRFFETYHQIFPHVLAALRESIEGAKPWLELGAARLAGPIGVRAGP